MVSPRHLNLAHDALNNIVERPVPNFTVPNNDACAMRRSRAWTGIEGVVLAQLILDGTPPTPIDDFDIGRFAA